MRGVFDAISSLVVTEKSSKLNDELNHLTVFSPLWVTKGDLRHSLMSIFADIEIKKIRSMTVNGKKKRFKGRDGKRSDRKKFIISLVGDAKIFDNKAGFGG